MRTPHKLTPSRLLAQLHHVIKLLLALRARLRRRDGLIKKLRTQLASFTVRTTPTRIAHHTYPAEMIAIAVNTVVEANGSLRCAAKVAGYLNEMMGWDFKTPSLTVVSTWVKRLGRYALDHSAVKTGRYVAIIDESIQIGGEKYLLWLGVKLREDRSPFAPLTMADAEILGVEVQSCWTAREVEAFVCRRLRHHHQVELVYLISDQGTNLLKAGAALGQQMVADCSHVLMNALIKLLADNVALQTLTRFMGTFRRQHILSNRSALCPPSLRDKGGGSPMPFS